MVMEDMRLLNLKEVMDICKIGKSTIYALMGAGKFPRPVRVGGRAVRWRWADIQEWLRSRPPTAPDQKSPDRPAA